MEDRYEHDSRRRRADWLGWFLTNRLEELPTAGEVLILDKLLSGLDRRARAALRRAQIAIVGQQPGLTPFLSSRENVELGFALRGRAADREAAAEALDAVGRERTWPSA